MRGIWNDGVVEKSRAAAESKEVDKPCQPVVSSRAYLCRCRCSRHDAFRPPSSRIPASKFHTLASQILHSCHACPSQILHSCQSDLQVTIPRTTIHTPFTAIAAAIAQIRTARSEAAPNRPDAVIKSLKEESASDRTVA
jgi:hypothetical protein